MKYNTISTSSLASEGKKSSFTIYADMNISHNKMADSEAEITSIRGELEIVQKALKLQTKRCRQLVTEYTKRLQEKEQQYQSEKMLRDDQLAKVLRALLIFEARLKQEQKIISNQLKEKDYIIKKQNNDIKKLLSSTQYCKNCQQYYSQSPNLESLDSSSEYVITDYQSSNFESLDSSSDIYATISEKSYNLENTDKSEEKEEESKSIYQKNKGKDSVGRRAKKFQHRKSIGTYFEVLKLRNDNLSPCSNEDNTSNDYDNLDSLPPESVTNKINLVSDDNKEESSSNISVSECNNTVINNNDKNEEYQTNDVENKRNKISESIPVFEGDGETNDNWYASASDQEDDEQRDIYRNNPVLECMNQILLQNINDPLNSPPKTPNVERKSTKNNKKVKFSDEEDNKTTSILTEENLKEKTEEIINHDYYETPIQKLPNFYETPQSIYSNDYEQILSKCSETFSNSSKSDEQDKKLANDNKGHFYIDMDITKLDNNDNGGKDNNQQQRKIKILRTPPALPPKPANLVSKYKMQNKLIKDNVDLLESEPDYCSISELNLPTTTKNVSFKKINVVAEINTPASQQQQQQQQQQQPQPQPQQDVVSKVEKASNNINNSKNSLDCNVTNENSNLIVKKCVEKFNIQMAKQTPIKSDKIKIEPEIPKLPQVSEIIIPDENDEKQNDDERISHDNYVKNNSQILKLKKRKDQNRGPIVMGTSVSNLITGFNNQQLISEINKKPGKLDRKLFSSFENLQNLDKQTKNSIKEPETPNFDNFDLSQNFEEFKLDDCEIEEYNVEDLPQDNDKLDNNNKNLTTRVDIIRATTNDVAVPNLSKNSVELLKKQLELQKNKFVNEQNTDTSQYRPEPTYEHFLECTGLSSKSILTPSRLLSNHKSMLKPKDVKLRSKVKANNLFDRHSSGTIRYWSEPYV